MQAISRSLQNWNSAPIKQQLSFSCCPQFLATTIFSVSVNLTTLDISYKWHHTVLFFLRLAFFIQHNVLKIYVIVCVTISFLRLNNISLYGCTTFCLSVHPLMDTWVAFTLYLTFWGDAFQKTVFQSSYAISLPQQQCMRVPYIPHQHSLLSVFFLW